MSTTLNVDTLKDLARVCAEETGRRVLLHKALPPLLELARARTAVVVRRDHDSHTVPAEAGRVLDPGALGSMLEVVDEGAWSSPPVPAAWSADGIVGVLARRLPGAPEVLVLALDATADEVVGDHLAIGTALFIAAVGRRTAEEDLADLVARVGNAQQLAGMGDYDWDIATDTNRWSDQLYRIYGHEPQSFNASYERFLSLLHEDDRDPIMAIHQAALSSGEAYEMVERIVRPDGEMRYLASNGQVVMDESGKPARMRGTCIDITDRVLAEQERAGSAARFEALVEHSPDGILVLDGRRIVQANQLAREVLGGDPVGHRIEEIMVLSDPAARAVPAIGLDGRSLQLDVLTAALSSSEGQVRAIFLDDAGPRLAREAMAANLREAQVRERQAVEINDNVVQGLTAAGYCLELGDHDLAGTYLGKTLASARKMMSDLRGPLGDKPLRAGDFVRSSATSIEPEPTPVATPTRADRLEEDTPTVLIVDDSEDLRTLMRLNVERKLPGRVVGEAANGQEGVDLAAALQPDLVLLDLAMPRMDGIEALPLILAAAPAAKVVMLSGFDRRGVAGQLLEAGASRYVEKGTPMSELVVILRGVWTGEPGPLSA